MSLYKLVISGPVGAGKTTFIQTLSDTPVFETDEAASEDIGKARTTVAMDFGTMTLDGIDIHLWGTPGQERFSFMWDVLVEGSLGLILLVPGHQPKDFPAARKILEYLTSRHPVPFVLGVTRQDLARVWAPEDVADYFDLPHEQVLGINATDPDSAVILLTRLLEILAGPAEEVGVEQVA